jgi:cysteinyl-tRNA synthetase
MKNLGEYLDIHCGGIDNAFPHHTNEIAQSEAYLGHKWCNFWFHVHHLNTTGGKMSKSKGEFLTVSLLESKGYDPIVYRFFCLQSHYRKSLVFSYENLDNAKIAYDKLIARIAQLKAENDTKGIDEAKFNELKKNFKDALDNDINTALGITALYDVLKADTNAATKLALAQDFDKVLSLGLMQHAEKLASLDEQQDIPDEVMALVEQRTAARKAKDFAKADALRDEIASMGFVIEETRQGTKIRRK